MSNGKLTIVLSDWDGAEQSWRLPKLRGVGVDTLKDGGHAIAATKWSFSDSGEGPAVLWTADEPSPQSPCASIHFLETSGQNRLLDPGIFGPLLALVGVLAGLGVNYVNTNRTVAQDSYQQSLKSLESNAAAAGCTNNLPDAAGVTACFENYRLAVKNSSVLKDQLVVVNRKYSALQGSYNQVEAHLPSCQK